jgi:hypothetical protein
VSDQKEQARTNAGAEKQAQRGQFKKTQEKSAVRKLGGFLSRVSGYSNAKKNIAIVKHRASFPLLRRVLKNELSTTKSKPTVIQHTEVSEADRDRSLFWHTIIIAVTAPALLWSIFILTKALAIGLKFNVWNPALNQGLYTSIPMIVFTASKLYVSWHSRKAFKVMTIQDKREA